MSSQHPPKPRIHHFVQAPVKPLDEDGVVVGIVGTIGWAITTIILWFNVGWLDKTGHDWWLFTGVSGTILGLVGTAYCLWRRARRRQTS